MDKVKSSADSTPGFFTIEELKEKNQTPDKVFYGAKASENWRAGKAVTEADYKNALKEFLESPAGGRKVKKDAKGR